MKTNARTLHHLLNDERIHDTPNFDLRGMQRRPFEIDADKITFTEGFRALADKTQVHDRVQTSSLHRNRLTHSIEVSHIGRSLGVLMGARMISFYGLHDQTFSEAFWKIDPIDIGQIIAAAGLAHDIGTPPLGHAGEDGISAFFTETSLGKQACDLVDQNVSNQMRLHEANAQTFRMINRSMGWRQEGGLNLTAATLAAFCKYPFPLHPNKKKYGIHHADMPTMSKVAHLTSMTPDDDGWRRHPLAYLSEAADDIAYLCVDIEDATWMGLTDIDTYYELCRPIIGTDEIDKANKMNDIVLSTQYARSRMIRSIINGCLEAYQSMAEFLDQGTLPTTNHGHGIIAHTRHGEAFAHLRHYSHINIYNAPSVKATRERFQSSLKRALSHLVSDLLDYLQAGPPATFQQTEMRYPALARLPKARMGLHIPENPSEALPWLLDQITLMSDAQVLELSRL